MIVNLQHVTQRTAFRPAVGSSKGQFLIASIIAIATSLVCAPARGERADRDKPANIEAGRMVADDARRISTFEGNVAMTQGTMSLRADRVVVRQDAEGNYQATATGSPVRFRQRTDPKGERAAVWVDGEALRIELDDREQKIELFDKARVTRDQDEVRGEHIILDQRTESFTVSGGKGASDSRVRAVIQPKVAPPGRQ